MLKTILPPFPVFCTLDKYIVIQRRQAPFNLRFNRTWDEFKNGFGDLTVEFWLGLEKLYRITNQPYIKYSIRLEVTSTAGSVYYYQTDNFYIAAEKERYKIVSIGSTTARNIGSDNFVSAGQIFATREKDVAKPYGAYYNGFWYSNVAHVRVNSNVPRMSGTSGTIDHTEIKIRPLTV